ncbi:hypothetical protein CR513_11664, partial [Mucuna pruriens]
MDRLESRSPSLEDLVKQMATSNIQFQQNLTVTIQDLQTHIGKLATTTNQLQSNGFGQIPYQTIVNPKENIWLSNSRPKQFHYPSQAQQSKKVEINIPILKYEKFLKKSCTHKRKKLKGDVEMRRNVYALIKSKQVSTLIQPPMPKKCRDPNTIIVSCTIGNCTFVYAMLDLGVSINVMPSSVYKSLKLGDLKPTSVIIQLENRSIAHPLGILEDVLAQIFMLDMEDESSRKGSTLIIGRLFLMTTRTKVDPLALELKPLPKQLKYAYLEDDQKLLFEQENRLLQVLRKHRKAISWTLAYLRGINPSICMHRILLEEEAQLMVLEKSRMIVVKNQNNKLIPTNVKNSWQVICRFILYQKINIRPPSLARLAFLPTLGCRMIHICGNFAMIEHYGLHQIAQKILDSGFFWSTIFKDAHHIVTTYE